MKTGLVARCRRLVLLCVGAAAMGCAGTGTGVATQAEPEPYAYVAFRAAGNAGTVIAGRLTLPRAAPRPMPAVVIVHGSAGVDSRSIDHARALQRAGFATLEIDLWSARWPTGGPLQRPKGVPETLPDVFGALAFLAAHQAIDKSRIGVMGFSWGGVVSMLSATRAYAQKYTPAGVRFAAHAPLYPVCWAYGRVPGYEFADLTGAPVLVHVAELDDYDRPDTCVQLVAGLAPADRRLVDVLQVAGATHGFDRRGPDLNVVDPYAHLGKGGEVRMIFHPQAAAQALEAVAQFFRTTLGARHP